MRITVTIDDGLYQQALKLAGPGTDRVTLLREAMQTFIRVQSGKRSAALGDQTSQVAGAPHRRSLAEVLTAIPPAEQDDGWDGWPHSTMESIEKP
ncbi:type II toxin-antitoxin system VapB family antitoxin [Comamonas flocculans]|uniref:Type II toxin-antitoxin system VapB family antitoxin n=1 Tax=Comamonas flocculans TaxID=2597701 RepID=A0A5B8RQ80_9BURK|nr:type II toxin-antitoxin system VapB family antitoxin [Comamonas flocculans]